MTRAKNPLTELAWRGLAHQHTEGLEQGFVSGQVTAYCGFDPTAPSLHVGNLVPVMGLVHLQHAGHRPIALVGGGTGMIGDPSGKSGERQLAAADTVEANARAIRSQLERFLEFDERSETSVRAHPTSGALMRDNAEWLLPLKAVDFMRDVGKHFTVNYMMQKESVKARLEAGISYTEFSYMLLQAYDYLQLHERYGTTLQIGGSDQWGNITAGIELIRRTHGRTAHALTLPLVTTASGTKFGKTEAGAVWLDPARTTPYRFYQFWINTDDRDVVAHLKFFTFLDRAEIDAVESELAAHPERRSAQRRLAEDVTVRVHGAEMARLARGVSEVLFGARSVRELSEPEVDALVGELSTVDEDGDGASAAGQPASGASQPASAAGMLAERGVTVIDLLTEQGIVKSRGEARRLIQQGGLYLNGERCTEDRAIAQGDLVLGRYLFVRKGAREQRVIRFKDA